MDGLPRPFVYCVASLAWFTLSCDIELQSAKFRQKVYTLFLSDLVVLITTVADNSLPYLVQSANLAVRSYHLLTSSYHYSLACLLFTLQRQSKQTGTALVVLQFQSRLISSKYLISDWINSVWEKPANDSLGSNQLLILIAVL